MNYKHKFYLIKTWEDNERIELATCRDGSTAYVLEDYCRRTYEGNTQGLQIVTVNGKKETILVCAGNK